MNINSSINKEDNDIELADKSKSNLSKNKSAEPKRSPLEEAKSPAIIKNLDVNRRVEPQVDDITDEEDNVPDKSIEIPKDFFEDEVIAENNLHCKAVDNLKLF